MKTSSFICCLLILLAFGAMPADLAAQKKRPRVKPIITSVTVSASNPTPQQRRSEAFETAWSIINHRYFDKTFGGLDWKKMRMEYSPRVARARSDAEFHRILEEMIGRLGKSHLNVIAPDYFVNLEKAKKQARLRGKQLAAEKRAANGTAGDLNDDDDDGDASLRDPASSRYGIGVDLRMIDGRIVITRLEKDSAAIAAGLRPGYVIEKVNGVSLSQMIRQALADGNKSEELKYLLPIQIVDSFLNGEPDTSVFLTCLDENDALREFVVPRLELAGESISISKNLPEQFLKYEARPISSDVGYIRFNAFAIPVIEKVCNSISEFHDKKAIIIDLRGNLGGVLGSMIGLSGMMSDRPLTLGTFVSRGGSEPFTAEAKNKNFKGQIILLVDGLSMSAAELFTAGLQGNGRATVIGERTGGQSLPAVWVKLVTGAVMVYPVADFITPNGISLEGSGLKPDHVVTMDRRSLLLGKDPQLEKALSVIGSTPAPAKPVHTAMPAATVIGSVQGPPPPPAKLTAENSDSPPPPAPRAAEVPSDSRSLKVIADFTGAIGGAEAIKRISGYEARGTVSMGPNGENEGSMYAAREFPDKFMMVMNTPSLGELREVYNGSTLHLQADYGLDRSVARGPDTSRVHLFAPIFNVLEAGYLKEMKFEGEFEIEGRMRQIITAKTVTGHALGMSFDSVSKMLVTFALPGALYTMEDYRKTDGVTMPYSLETEGTMKVLLDSVTINPTFKPGSFEKKEKCFDKVD